jgi:hypothetical protein
MEKKKSSHPKLSPVKLPEAPEIEMNMQFETVRFIARHKGIGVHVDLNINFLNNSFTITQRSEEGIRFDKDSVEEAEVKMLAVNAAIKYLREKTDFI